jgi:hypothetical protein
MACGSAYRALSLAPAPVLPVPVFLVVSTRVALLPCFTVVSTLTDVSWVTSVVSCVCFVVTVVSVALPAAPVSRGRLQPATVTNPNAIASANRMSYLQVSVCRRPDRPDRLSLATMAFVPAVLRD